MYDTVKLRLWTREAWRIGDKLIDYHQKRGGAHPTWEGRWKNLTVTIDAYGLTAEGSLSKYYFGSNLPTLTLSATARALDELSADFGLPMGQSDVWRVDVAGNLITKDPVWTYLQRLGVLPQYVRVPMGKGKNYDTLYYRSNKLVLAFYDKMKESQKHDRSIPELYMDKNVLRYELRLIHRCGEQTGIKGGLKAVDLCNEQVFTHLLNMWLKMYKKIRKDKALTASAINAFERKDYIKKCVLRGIKEDGGETAVVEKIKSAQRAGDMKRRKADATIRYVRDIVKECPESPPEHKRVVELDTLVERQFEQFG